MQKNNDISFPNELVYLFMCSCVCDVHVMNDPYYRSVSEGQDQIGPRRS